MPVVFWVFLLYQFDLFPIFFYILVLVLLLFLFLLGGGIFCGGISYGKIAFFFLVKCGFS